MYLNIVITIFPQSTQALIKNFSQKGRHFLEGGHLIERGAYYVILYDRTFYWSLKTRE